jgi:hypothetical protein
VTSRAGQHGVATIQFLVGNARPGSRVVIRVRVSGHGQQASCRVAFRPRAARVAVAPPPPPAAPAPAPAPSPSRSAAPPPPPAPSCYPLTDGGSCYEPGEFCRDSDHGASGVAGDGEKIRCEDNDGWRWEPV